MKGSWHALDSETRIIALEIKKKDTMIGLDFQVLRIHLGWDFVYHGLVAEMPLMQ